MQPYELVELQTTPTMEELIPILHAKFKWPDAYPSGRKSAHLRRYDVFTSLELVALHHLGFETPSPQERCNAGFDCESQYFLSDWWQQSGDRPPEEAWFEPFSLGLLLGLLASRWEEVARLCSWLDFDLDADFVQFDSSKNGEIADVYKVLAAYWSHTPHEEVLTKSQRVIQSSGAPRIKALSRLIEAGIKREQAVFDESIESALETVRRELKEFASNDGRIAARLATHESAVVLTCGRLWRLSLPALEPKLEALLLKRF